jgi:hypothetical protein
MDYKILIRLFVPEIDEIYELYIPINKYIGEISASLNKIVNELSKVYPIKNGIRLCNRRTGEIYKNNMPIRQTDIRNGTELVLF